MAEEKGGTLMNKVVDVNKFVFGETQFIAVTSYKNVKVRQLIWLLSNSRD